MARPDSTMTPGRAAPQLRAGAAVDGGAPLPTAAEMRAWDAETIDGRGVPERVLMEAAGRAAAEVLHRRFPDGRVVAAVGRGNNGGDALVLLRTLAARGRRVAVAPVDDAAMRRELLHGWEVEVVPPADAERALEGAAVVVDGLLGTGARGAPRPPYDALVRALNGCGRPVLALDAPTGVDMTTGTVSGEAVRAELTVAFGALKRGHLIWPGRAHCGRIVVVEIGLAPAAGHAAARLVTPAWARARLGPVPPNAHKGTMGDVVVVAGSVGVAGAAQLAGTGAARGGAGKVWLVSADENRVVLQAGLPEAIFVGRDDDAAVRRALESASAVVAGPGIGTDAAAERLLERVLDTGDAPLLLDADALTLLARRPELRERAGTRGLLLTPHPAEAGRLLGRPTADVAADPFASVRAVADRYDAAVLLKGHPSLVAERDGPVWANVSGHAGIATGGMGDTLAGVVGAFVAVGVVPAHAAAAALHHCGRAAELAGRGRALLPRDVAEALGDAMLERAGAGGPLPAGVLLELAPAR